MLAVSYFVDQQGGNVSVGGGGTIDSQGNIDIWTGSPGTGNTYPVGRIENHEPIGITRLELTADFEGTSAIVSGEKHWYFGNESTSNSGSAPYEWGFNNKGRNKQREDSWTNFVDRLNNTNLEFGVDSPIGGFSGIYSLGQMKMINAKSHSASLNIPIAPLSNLKITAAQNFKNIRSLDVSASTPIGGGAMSYDGKNVNTKYTGPRINLSEYGVNFYIGFSWE